MANKDPFAKLAFEPLDVRLAPWVTKVNERELCMVQSPDGKDVVIFNDDYLERGCMQVMADGTIKAAWRAHPWGDIDDAAAQEVLEFLATGRSE